MTVRFLVYRLAPKTGNVSFVDYNEQ